MRGAWKRKSERKSEVGELPAYHWEKHIPGECNGETDREAVWAVGPQHLARGLLLLLVIRDTTWIEELDSERRRARAARMHWYLFAWHCM